MKVKKFELRDASVDEISSVNRAAQKPARAVLMKRDDRDYWKRDFTADQRKKLAASGAAMEDGSFPIANSADLHNAMQAIGRAKNPDAVKAHIRTRAKALGLEGELSDAFSKAGDVPKQEKCANCGETVTPADGNCPECGAEMDSEPDADDVSKYSPDQPRDANGKWGAGDQKLSDNIANAHESTARAMDAEINQTRNPERAGHLNDAMRHLDNARFAHEQGAHHGQSGAITHLVNGLSSLSRAAQVHGNSTEGAKQIKDAYQRASQTLSSMVGSNYAKSDGIAKPGGPTKNGDDAMGDKEDLAKANAELAKARAVLALSKADRDFYDALPAAAQDPFLALDATGRAGELKKAADLNPVVYTSKMTGVEFRKNDSAREISLAKSNDALSEKVAELAKANADAELEKRAAEFESLPGGMDVAKAELRSIDAEPDAEMKKKRLERLRASNAAMADTFRKHGSAYAPKAGTPQAEFDALVAATMAKSTGVDRSKVVADLLKTAEGKRLYNEIEIAKRQASPAA